MFVAIFQMFDNLTPADRRKILLASRIRFTPEVEVPRRRAIEKMIETCLFVVPKSRWSSATEIMDSFEQIAGFQTLQVRAVIDGLDRLVERGRVEVRPGPPQYTYRLRPEAIDSLQNDFNDTSARLSRVLESLYADVVGNTTKGAIVSFFLEVVCEFFSHLGSQWADYLGHDRTRPPVAFEAVQSVIQKKMQKFGFDHSIGADITRRTLYFFEHSDPDFDYLKFSLGQSFYIARLLGMEGKDYLSGEIFRDKIL